ncbi:MAG: hypothetical protein HY427_01315 [Candidatus Levybacteria bacterium]|nr:hypothetical protein [Candidatus Levybacteria bacterium]
MSSAEVRPFTPLLREVAKQLTSPFLRSEVITSEEDGMKESEQLLLEGYGGIILLRHFSLKDPFQIIRDTLANKALIRKEALTPMALHQVYPLLKGVAGMLEIKIDPIVTNNTVRRFKEKGKTPPGPNEGLRGFTADAIGVLRRGGILYIAPEGERKDHLEQYSNRAIGTLLVALKRSGLSNVAFLFVDLRLAGREENYWGKKGLNLLNRYETRIGRALTLDQVMEMAGGRFGNVDSDVILPEMQRTAAISRPSRD